MPPPVRRKTLVLVLALGAALALAAVAYAGNGGFAPVEPASPNAERIIDSYLWISIFAIAIFALVEGALVMFIVNYRRRGRPRTAEGPQIHGATRLELIWTAVPVLILAAIAASSSTSSPGSRTSRAQGRRAGRWRSESTHTSSTGSSRIRTAASRSTTCTYPSTASCEWRSTPMTSTTAGGSRARREVRRHPGRSDGDVVRGRTGRHVQGQMRRVLRRVPRRDARARDRALAGGLRRLGTAGGTAEPRAKRVGRRLCAMPRPEGRGRLRAGHLNSSLLIQPESLRALLRQGQNTSGDIDAYMPPVGRGWSARQFRALEEYLKANLQGSPEWRLEPSPLPRTVRTGAAAG